MSESEEQSGDWYCPNCGYLSASRVTYHETCDECHVPVSWHTVDEMSAIERAVIDERDACMQLMCRECARGFHPTYIPRRKHWVHQYEDGTKIGCIAAKLHDRAALEEKKE